MCFLTFQSLLKINMKKKILQKTFSQYFNIPSVRTTIHWMPSPNDLWLSGTHLKDGWENFSHYCTQECVTALKPNLSLWLWALPQSSCESRNTAQKREGDDDEEEGEESWHVLTEGSTLSCYGQAFLTSWHIAHNAATVCKHLNTDAHT